MSLTIEKTGFYKYIYKYILYKYKKEARKNRALEGIGIDDQIGIWTRAAKKTSRIGLSLGILYLMLVLVVTFQIIIDPYQNAFTLWYYDQFEALIPLINGDWGCNIYEKQGTILWIACRALPILLVNFLPIIIVTVLIANIYLEKELKAYFDK